MNIPYTMLIRAIKYCSTFETYVDEREKLRMAFLLNKYPNEFIDKQFDRVFQKHNLIQPVAANDYKIIREKLIYSQKNENIQIDYRRTLFVHFTYCLNMKTFPTKFHALWNKYFTESPINEIKPVLEGSPILLVSENSNKEPVEKKARPDTPVDSAAKRPRLFSHVFKPPRVAPRSQQQQEIVIQHEEVLPLLPTTPPVSSPRQSTPRTPIAPPRPLTTSPQIEPSYQVENRDEPQIVEIIQVNEQVAPMEQEIVRNSPSVIPKDMEDFKIELFDFPIIPIE
ncbi:unnamed protein product, partial [Rotaria sp. Silwood1]